MLNMVKSIKKASSRSPSVQKVVPDTLKKLGDRPGVQVGWGHTHEVLVESKILLEAKVEDPRIAMAFQAFLHW